MQVCVCARRRPETQALLGLQPTPLLTRCVHQRCAPAQYTDVNCRRHHHRELSHHAYAYDDDMQRAKRATLLHPINLSTAPPRRAPTTRPAIRPPSRRQTLLQRRRHCCRPSCCTGRPATSTASAMHDPRTAMSRPAPGRWRRGSRASAAAMRDTVGVPRRAAASSPRGGEVCDEAHRRRDEAGM